MKFKKFKFKKFKKFNEIAYFMTLAHSLMPILFNSLCRLAT